MVPDLYSKFGWVTEMLHVNGPILLLNHSLPYVACDTGLIKEMGSTGVCKAWNDRRLPAAVDRRFVSKRLLHDSPRSFYSEGASTSSNANDNVSNEHVGSSNAATQATKGTAAWFPRTLRQRFLLEDQLDSTLVRLVGKVKVGNAFMSKGDNEVPFEFKTEGGSLLDQAVDELDRGVKTRKKGEPLQSDKNEKRQLKWLSSVCNGILQVDEQAENLGKNRYVPCAFCNGVIKDAVERQHINAAEANTRHN
ncbi:hypothetical protein Tco_1113619 [Tanacetum coccineum]|uniref:Uncharacterized protein n=1 Tax=Tanacetum coccineum TaxID=301880 RepID=A0ABQ5ISP4_9ASTR